MLFQLLNYESGNVIDQTKNEPMYISLSMIKFFLRRLFVTLYY